MELCVSGGAVICGMYAVRSGGGLDFTNARVAHKRNQFRPLPIAMAGHCPLPCSEAVGCIPAPDV